MIQHLDHLQLALPAGAEPQMRAFWCDLLGCIPLPKPAALAGRGGFWARAGSLELHFGVDPDFTPATKAHPGFVVADIAALAARLTAADHPFRWDPVIPGVTRFFTADPVGNRLEFIAAPSR